jgi:hypothetical protein
MAGWALTALPTPVAAPSGSEVIREEMSSTPVAEDGAALCACSAFPAVTRTWICTYDANRNFVSLRSAGSEDEAEEFTQSDLENLSRNNRNQTG